MNAPSPFAAARTIRDVGSYLPVDLGGLPYDREEHGRAARSWLERSQAPLPSTVQNAEYFNNGMADLQILGLEIGPQQVRVTVDLDDAQGFANALDGVLGRQPARGAWPVDLLMDGVTAVRMVEHDSQGTLRDVAVPSQATRDPRGVGSLVNEWFFAHGERLGWVAETYGLASTGAEPTVHLLVDCARASVVDRRLERLVGAFGPAVVPLWQDALADLVVDGQPRAFWTLDEVAEYLVTKLAAQGLTRTDFKTSS